MTSGKKKQQAGAANDFPALRQFFSAYLHQDFRGEYGSAANAAKNFCQDASQADRAAIRKEWKNWRAGLKNLSAANLALELRRLGSAWAPPNVAALDEVGMYFENVAKNERPET